MGVCRERFGDRDVCLDQEVCPKMTCNVCKPATSLDSTEIQANMKLIVLYSCVFLRVDNGKRMKCDLATRKPLEQCLPNAFSCCLLFGSQSPNTNNYKYRVPSTQTRSDQIMYNYRHDRFIIARSAVGIHQDLIRMVCSVSRWNFRLCLVVIF
jgi:hypothetical protein